jgi:hypothetical protein
MKLFSGGLNMRITDSEVHAVIAALDNTLSGNPANPPDAETVDKVAKFLIRLRGYADIGGRRIYRYEDIWNNYEGGIKDGRRDTNEGSKTENH